MRNHLIRARAVEQAIRERLQTDNNIDDDSHKRVLVDLIGVRIAAIDALLLDVEGGHPNNTFGEAMERIRQHFDKDAKTPYKAWRGATPKDQPSLSKDIVIVFEQLAMEGVWHGDIPQLDPRWDAA